MKLIDDAYYYVYMQMDDEDGTYYPVEDVSLYQALVGETIGKNLCDYLSDDFKWNIADTEDEEPKSNTIAVETNTVKPTNTVANTNTAKRTDTVANTNTAKETDTTTAPINKLPQTGEKVTIIAIIACAIGVTTLFYIKSKKYNY